jgi:hypothetical protein
MGQIHLAGLNRYALKDKRRKKAISNAAPDSVIAVPANTR